MTLFRLAMANVMRGLSELRTQGRVSDDTLQHHMLTRRETYELLCYTPSVPWEYPSRSCDTGDDTAVEKACQGREGEGKGRTQYREEGVWHDKSDQSRL
jgi:hypothetical protein